MTSEQEPFEESLKILADLIAKKHLDILKGKEIPDPSFDISGSLASDSDDDGSGRKGKNDKRIP
jgi:hypothetical protein